MAEDGFRSVRGSDLSTRYDALRALLALPDPVDLPVRTRRYTQAGDTAKQDRLKRDLAAAYVQYQMQAYGDDGTIVSVRRFSLRLVRRAS